MAKWDWANDWNHEQLLASTVARALNEDCFIEATANISSDSTGATTVTAETYWSLLPQPRVVPYNSRIVVDFDFTAEESREGIFCCDHVHISRIELYAEDGSLLMGVDVKH